MSAQNHTKQVVPIKYFELFTYRMYGLNFKEISARTGYSYDHVRHVFSKGGVLYDFWHEWGEEFRAEALEQSLDMLYAHLPDIVRANIMAAKNPNSLVGVAARKLIFDRIFGKQGKMKGCNEEQKSYSFTDWIKEQTLKMQEEDRLYGSSGENA